MKMPKPTTASTIQSPSFQPQQPQRKRKRNQRLEDNKRQKSGQTSIKKFFSKTTKTTVFDLPNELLYNIFSFLPHQSIVNLALTCKAFSIVASGFRLSTKTTVFDLPNELLYNIFSFLPHQSIVNLALTCKAFSIVARGFRLSTKTLEYVSVYSGIGASFSEEFASLSEEFKYWGDITPVSLFTYISKTHELTLNDIVQNMPTAIIDVAIQVRACEISDEDIHKRTPLHYAAQNENGSEVTEKLLAAGANTKVMDVNGKRPLHYAAQNENGSEVTEKLLAAGANTEVMDVNGKRPLHYAAENSNGSEVTEKLLAAGANTEVMDVNGKTPLHYAAKSGNDNEVIQLLAAGANAEVIDVHGAKPLHYAAFAGWTKNILTLTRVAVSILDIEGRTPLHYAMNCRSLYSITALLEQGADVNKQDELGKTPLHYLLEHEGFLYYNRFHDEVDDEVNYFNYDERYDVVKELLLWNADVQIRDSNGQTPLHYAALNNDLHNMLQLLNVEGVDVNVKDLDGRTPLHHCVMLGTISCTRKLINAGASVDIRDESGKTAILYAVSNNDIDLLLILLEGHAKLGLDPDPIIFYDGISEPERILIAKILLDMILQDEYRAFIELWRDFPSNSYTPRWNTLLS